MEIIEDNRSFDKTMGIVAYMTLIGWVVALVINNSKTGAEKQFTAFHLRQMLALLILGFCVQIVNVPLAFIPILGWLLSIVLSLSVFVLWILGVVSAVNGEKKELPIIGPVIQSTLKNLFD
jgi:uncharacterized membrane protein